MNTQPKRLILARNTVRTLTTSQLELVAAGEPPHPTTALTDGNNGCQSEATGCHTGWTACGTC